MTVKLYTGRVPICRGLSAAFLVLFSSLFMAACGTTADKFLPGAAMLSSLDSVVVFGKVEVDEYQKYLKDNPELAKKFDLANYEDVKLELQTFKNRKSWGINSPTLDIRLEHGEDYFAIIPKENYFLDRLWGVFIATIKCQNLGFRVPQHASAVYVGTLVFQVKRTFWTNSVTFSIRDEYDQALRHFRSRNPDFSGEIVKSLFHGDQLSCHIPSNLFIPPLI